MTGGFDMRLRLLVVGLAAMLASLDARAQLLYGDFETLQILGSPDYLGNTSGYPAAPWQMITNDAFVPAGLYTNFGPDEGAPFCCDQLASVPPVDGKHYLLLTPRTLTSIPSIEAWLGLAAGAIAASIPPPQNLNCNQGVCGPTDGFAVRQTFAANAGDEIQFSFDFGNNRLAGYAAENESAIATLVGPTTATVLLLSNSSGQGAPVAGPTAWAYDSVRVNSNGVVNYGNYYPAGNSTGWVSRTITAPETGNLTLGFALINQYDTTTNNYLLVDAVRQIPGVPSCNDGIDNDGDGLVDFPADPGCSSPTDISEHDAALPCDDGLDNDGDGLIDFPADPGCFSPTSTTESPQCQDGIDNDGDGKIDFDGGASANHGVALAAADPQCTKPYRNSEKPNSGCGLGTELAFALPILMGIGRRRSRSGRA
jgi:hypothetical protein